MEIKVLRLGLIRTNCYLVSTDKAAIVIDPGFISNETEDFLKGNEGKERLILLTHNHFDHIGGADILRKNTGVKIAIGEIDGADLSNPEVNLSYKFRAHLEPFSADIFLKDGEILKVGDIEFKVILTPGHTLGSICLHSDDILFSGDTLFYESVGRTDFINGDFNAIKNSIQKLYELDGDTVVLSGHGEQTTIAHEKLYNPFVKG